MQRGKRFQLALGRPGKTEAEEKLGIDLFVAVPFVEKRGVKYRNRKFP